MAWQGIALTVSTVVRHTEEIQCRGDTRVGRKATKGKETLLKHDPLSGRAQQGKQDLFFFSAKQAGAICDYSAKQSA